MRTDKQEPRDRLTATCRLRRVYPEFGQLDKAAERPRCRIDDEEYELNDEGEWEALED